MKAIRFLAVGVLLALAACSKPAATDKPAEPPRRPPSRRSSPSTARPSARSFRGLRARPWRAEPLDRALARRPRADQGKPRPHRAHRAAGGEGSASRRIRRSPRASSWRGSNCCSRRAAQKYLKDHTPTEAEMRAEFEAQIASAPLVEYQARHILVSSEDVAQKIIAAAQGRQRFRGAGQAHVEPTRSSAAKGGDLGWFGPRDMDPAVHQCRGAAEERRVHQDAGADAVRLARDPAAEHARPHAARVRRREGPARPRSWWPRSSRRTRTRC